MPFDEDKEKIRANVVVCGDGLQEAIHPLEWETLRAPSRAPKAKPIAEMPAR